MRAKKMPEACAGDERCSEALGSYEDEPPPQGSSYKTSGELYALLTVARHPA